MNPVSRFLKYIGNGKIYEEFLLMVKKFSSGTCAVFLLPACMQVTSLDEILYALPWCDHLVSVPVPLACAYLQILADSFSPGCL